MVGGKKRLAVITLVLLAGCQQANKDVGSVPAGADNSSGLTRALENAYKSSGGVGSADESAGLDPQPGGSGNADEYTPTEAFKGKLEVLGLRMSERLLSKCIERASGESMETCFHTHMLAAFDANGAVAGHCPQRPDLEADLKCITLGGIAYKLAPKVGDDAMKGFDWDDPEKSTNDLSSQFVLQRIRECLADGAASDPKECVMKRITTGLELTSGDLEPCNVVIDDDYKFGQCIGEAFGYKFMSEGISRI